MVCRRARFVYRQYPVSGGDRMPPVRGDQSHLGLHRRRRAQRRYHFAGGLYAEDRKFRAIDPPERRIVRGDMCDARQQHLRFSGRRAGPAHWPLPQELENRRQESSHHETRRAGSCSCQVARKAHATWQPERGAPESVLQDRLGHAPGSTVTREYYVQMTDDACKSAVSTAAILSKRQKR